MARTAGDLSRSMGWMLAINNDESTLSQGRYLQHHPTAIPAKSLSYEHPGNSITQRRPETQQSTFSSSPPRPNFRKHALRPHVELPHVRRAELSGDQPGLHQHRLPAPQGLVLRRGGYKGRLGGPKPPTRRMTSWMFGVDGWLGCWSLVFGQKTGGDRQDKS